jgi:hypothetical protein
MAYVDLEEVGEEVGFALEGGEGPGHEGRRTVHQEHGAGHEMGEAMEAGVGALVEGQIFGAESVGQFESLTETEGEAFAGDGVDRAGGVADEGDVAGGDVAETPAHGDGSAGSVAGVGQGETVLQGWEES